VLERLRVLALGLQESFPILFAFLVTIAFLAGQHSIVNRVSSSSGTAIKMIHMSVSVGSINALVAVGAARLEIFPD